MLLCSPSLPQSLQRRTNLEDWSAHDPALCWHAPEIKKQKQKNQSPQLWKKKSWYGKYTNFIQQKFLQCFYLFCSERCHIGQENLHINIWKSFWGKGTTEEDLFPNKGTLKIRVWVDANKLPRLCLWGTLRFGSQHHRYSTQMLVGFSCSSWPARQLLNCTINNWWLREIKSMFCCQQNGKPFGKDTCAWRVMQQADVRKGGTGRKPHSQLCRSLWIWPSWRRQWVGRGWPACSGCASPLWWRKETRRRTSRWQESPFQSLAPRDRTSEYSSTGHSWLTRGWEHARFPIVSLFPKVLRTLSIPHNQSWVLHRGMKLQSVES